MVTSSVGGSQATCSFSEQFALLLLGNPSDGPQEPSGLVSAGFEALMSHSGESLEILDISLYRQIAYQSFAHVFNGKRMYPLLSDINSSFPKKIDTVIVAGMFKGCPSMTKGTAFGCFNVIDVLVPKKVALIGVPNAQDCIVQEEAQDFDFEMEEVMQEIEAYFKSLERDCFVATYHGCNYNLWLQSRLFHFRLPASVRTTFEAS